MMICVTAPLTLAACAENAQKKQFDFFRAYLKGVHGDAYEASDAELEALYREVNPFALAAHLMWGIWALVMWRDADDIEFDYLEYAAKRLKQYFATKEELLGLLRTSAPPTAT